MSTQIVERAFEKERGISRVEVRDGFAQISVTGMAEPLVRARSEALEAVASVGVSIDFLKLCPGGFSFLVREEDSQKVEASLAATGAQTEVLHGRKVVMVHAVNVRDEEGLVAKILFCALETKASISHVSDMHDRVLLVVGSDDADRLASHLKTVLGNAS